MMSRAVLWRGLKRNFSAVPASRTLPSIQNGGDGTDSKFIQARGPYDGQSSLVLREVGSTRTVFLLRPNLYSKEIEAIGHQIKLLSESAGIASVLVVSGTVAEGLAGLPLTVLETQHHNSEVVDVDIRSRGSEAGLAVGGYDPLEVFKTNEHTDPVAIQTLLDSLSLLADATRGSPKSTRIPVITVPHGLITDGGYSFCMGSYVLATPDTSFRILNPSRGLSFDPVGLSFFLPRLGWEFQQASARYTGCGLLLALSGIEANAVDMLETGLATHFIESPSSSIGAIEQSLSQLVPWNQQRLVKDKVRLHGQAQLREDANAAFRNVAVANHLYAFTSHHITGDDMLPDAHGDVPTDADPTTDLDGFDWYEEVDSRLLNYAATFDMIFTEETSVAGIIARFKEMAAAGANGEQESEVSKVAEDLALRMECQSPLALSVVYRLMQEGARNGATLDACIEREKRAQAKLFGMEDFMAWGSSSESKAMGKCPPWKHKSVDEVSEDEITEVVG